MKILIVEDGNDKRENIVNVVRTTLKENIEIAKTYFSAKNKLISIKKKYDLIILDMFLPDAKDDKELKGLAGKDLIFDMRNSGINTPVLVVTQYTEYTDESIDHKGEAKKLGMLENDLFGMDLDESSGKLYDCTYFEGLHEYLRSEIPMYLGIIFYSNQSKNWEEYLMYFINKAKEVFSL